MTPFETIIYVLLLMLSGYVSRMVQDFLKGDLKI